MTVKEASKTVEGYLPDCDTRKFVLDILARAEKKKPILKYHYNDEYFSTSVECGNCGKILGSWDNGCVFCIGSKELFIEQNLFCRRCGQAIDWSDVK